MKGKQTLLYDHTGRATTFGALLHESPRDVPPPRSRERVTPVPRHLQKPPVQEKGMIRGVSFLDTPDDEPTPPQDRERARRAAQKSITVGEYEDLVNGVESMKDRLFVNSCISYGTLFIIVILLIDRFL